MVYETHPEFEEPDDDDVIWRYMSFAKFMSLLANRALYFARLDKFEDRFEGHLTNPSFETMGERLRNSYAQMREETIVNCWCVSQYESIALWRTFVKNGEGIAIRSTFARLRDSIQLKSPFNDQSLMIGKVQYVNFSSHNFSDDGKTAFNGFRPLIHKRLFYEYEHELRAVIACSPLSAGKHIISQFAGWNVEVDLENLIVAIHIAPDSQSWFRETAEFCAKAFGFDPRIVDQSSIDEKPPE